MEDIITKKSGAEAVPAASTSTASGWPSGAEQQLAQEIRELWAEHEDAKAAVKRTKSEIRAVRERLSERLSQMKLLLAKPGRNGGWSSYLRSEKIAKATADRLVRSHDKFAGPQPNVVSEQVSDPTEADVERLFNSLWPRLSRTLTTRRAVFRFLCWYVGNFEMPYEKQDTGLLVLYPRAESTGTATAPAS